MYCPKCKFTSFDHLPACPKCRFDWQEARNALNLGWMQSSGFEWFAREQAPVSDATESFAFQDNDQDFLLSAEDSTENMLSDPLASQIPTSAMPDQGMTPDGRLQTQRGASASTPPDPVVQDDVMSEIDSLLHVDLGHDDLSDDADALHIDDFGQDPLEKDSSRKKATTPENDLPVWEIEKSDNMDQARYPKDSSEKKPFRDVDSADPGKSSGRDRGNGS